MNGIVLYQSKYGATEKYVCWLTEITHFQALETRRADLAIAQSGDLLILAGGVYASGIAGLSFLKKHIGKLNRANVAVFCVGASPYDEAAFAQLCAHNFQGALSGIPCFYGRGAWHTDAMTLADRTLCRLLQKAVAKKDPATYEPWESALMSAVGHDCDWTDKAYLQPLLDWIQARSLTSADSPSEAE